MKARFAKLVIDVADILSEPKNGDAIWWAINRVAHKLGANAVNGGAFQNKTKEIDWVRSSRDPLWLEEYANAGLYEIDPLLNAAMMANRGGTRRWSSRRMGIWSELATTVAGRTRCPRISCGGCS